MKDINGHTRVCGVIGNPVEHTMSPVIHNNLAAATGDNLVYVPFHVENELVKEAVEGALGLNLLGMNVTVPHKSAVIPYLKEIDPLANNIGACNTLVRVEGGFKGYNTDMPGLYRAMQKDGVSISGEDVILLGAGGVARAVCMLLCDKGAAHVYILNRSMEKAQKVCDEINTLFGKELVSCLELSSYEELAGKKYLAIQATRVGMHPNVEHAVIEDPAFYEMVHTAYDIVFNPLDTKFMQLARTAGARSFNGLRMLLYQGVIAYELWTKQSIDDALSQSVYEKMLEAMNK